MFFDCGGNPLHLVIPSLLKTVKTTFGRSRFLIDAAHTYTRWHTLSNDSQLLPDTAKHCETLPGLPTETHNVTHSFLIFHVKPILQTNAGELLIAQICLDMFYWRAGCIRQLVCHARCAKSMFKYHKALVITKASAIKQKIGALLGLHNLGLWADGTAQLGVNVIHRNKIRNTMKTCWLCK